MFISVRSAASGTKTMKILALNPWITDFAAYDFWLKPYGFLVLLTYLKRKGFEIDYIDCLDEKIISNNFGRGSYPHKNLPNPQILSGFPRLFKQYGVEEEHLIEKIKKREADYILLTSSMTYWYPGVKKISRILKEYLPGKPLILGGVYPTLCYEHARNNISCDLVIKNNEMDKFFKFIGTDYNRQELYSTLPEYELFYPCLDYAVLRTSWGCPYRCPYCAVKELHPDFFRVPEEKIIAFLTKHTNKGVKDFVFYDDALLSGKEYIKKVLKQLISIKKNIRFHTPNALHLKYLDEELACLLKKSGFHNPHFGLETTNPLLQQTWGNKANTDNLIKGIDYLKKGGYREGEFSVYMLLGYPGQKLAELKKEIEFVNSLGVKISLAEFSPVPKTQIFNQYQKKLREPLLQNNSVFTIIGRENIEEIRKLKNYVKDLNKKITAFSSP
ncbi:MAG: radical SAM protein [Candidatus Omnitrophica bacterium]|nr:radical SAM protein [Candidatus Omnitrophota bacterium]MBD3268605.1 radical SAM protein [Candidatus Omnitrophota bacterium]